MDQVGVPIPDMPEHIAASIMISDSEDDDDAIDPQEQIFEDVATSEENEAAPGSWLRVQKVDADCKFTRVLRNSCRYYPGSGNGGVVAVAAGVIQRYRGRMQWGVVGSLSSSLSHAEGGRRLVVVVAVAAATGPLDPRIACIEGESGRGRDRDEIERRDYPSSARDWAQLPG
ncbi:hypothetical protein EDB84DRAFT_1445058 [Lactarius hengduanensis]|nr:hypothetical protein EDB84DRAFT_1445058 [Lactarius hengduanensis]